MTNTIKKITRSIAPTLICAVIAAMTITFVAQFVNISGNSMEPNYHNGDIVVINKLAQTYNNGDVIVIKDVLDTPIIKRVIATEGDTVEIDPNKSEIVINGVPVYGETYNAPNGATYLNLPEELATEFPLTVEPNTVFVLGDNRKTSHDSRFKDIGLIPKEKIMGKVIATTWPPERFSLSNHVAE